MQTFKEQEVSLLHTLVDVMVQWRTICITCTNSLPHEILCQAQIRCFSQLQHLCTSPMASCGPRSCRCGTKVHHLIGHSHQCIPLTLPAVGDQRPNPHHCHCQSIQAFINNVMLSVGGNDVLFQALIQQAKNQLQWWNSLIQASGGALNPANAVAWYTIGPLTNLVSSVLLTGPQ